MDEIEITDKYYLDLQKNNLDFTQKNNLCWRFVVRCVISGECR